LLTCNSEIEVEDGESAWITQDTYSICPKTKYKISGYAQLAVAPARVRSQPKPPVCTLQVCEAVTGKCSRLESLDAHSLSYVSTNFKTTNRQALAQFQVKVTCPFITTGHINTVYLDEFSIQQA
tara:strand:- start:611 stop:982 length:372 start_codon:yes stop_codon:yes gene_type:complete